MFNKDPIVYANPHPAERDYGYIGSKHPNNQKNASLRMRSPRLDHPSNVAPSEEQSSSAIDVRGSSASGGYYPHHAQMRFQNLPNRSDFSPSGMTSGFSERDSPMRYQGHGEGQPRPHNLPHDMQSKGPSQITSKSRITNHTKYHNNESYDQVVMFKSEALDSSQLHQQTGNNPRKRHTNYGGYQDQQPSAEEFNTSRFSGNPTAG